MTRFLRRCCPCHYIQDLCGNSDDYEDFKEFSFGADFNESEYIKAVPELWTSRYPEAPITEDMGFVTSLNLMYDYWIKNRESAKSEEGES
jgi:hypothetical protein